MNLSYNQQIQALQELNSKLVEKFRIHLKLAFELEFYILGSNVDKIQTDFFNECYSKFRANNILTSKFYAESAPRQFEISIEPLECPKKAAVSILKIKNILKYVGFRFGYKINFESKPFEEFSGSALHVNISLHDTDGNNLLKKKVGDEEENGLVKKVIAGLCETMIESMIFFAPSKESYKRFQRNRNNENFPYDFAPVKVSWGGNNRTTAIRIPTCTFDQDSRHIEHRVPGADANPIMVTIIILFGIYYGIENELDLKYEKLFGNAFEEQFQVPELPKSLDEAITAYKNGRIIKSFLKNTVILCQN